MVEAWKEAWRWRRSAIGHAGILSETLRKVAYSVAAIGSDCVASIICHTWAGLWAPATPMALDRKLSSARAEMKRSHAV